MQSFTYRENLISKKQYSRFTPEDHVRALMKDSAGSLPVRFAVSGGSGATKPYKIVVVFNPRDNVSYGTMCQKEDKTPRTTNG